MVLLANSGWTRLPKVDNEYRAFHQEVKIRKDEINKGKGHSSGSGLVGHTVGHSAPSSASGSSLVRCPGNILSDISQLEVVDGGKRAGNNSAEIINEAADICRRLFQGGIMGIDVYQELIDELVEDHRDAHGYHSD